MEEQKANCSASASTEIPSSCESNNVPMYILPGGHEVTDGSLIVPFSTAKGHFR